MVVRHSRLAAMRNRLGRRWLFCRNVQVHRCIREPAQFLGSGPIFLHHECRGCRESRRFRHPRRSVLPEWHLPYRRRRLALLKERTSQAGTELGARGGSAETGNKKSGRSRFFITVRRVGCRCRRSRGRVRLGVPEVPEDRSEVRPGPPSPYPRMQRARQLPAQSCSVR